MSSLGGEANLQVIVKTAEGVEDVVLGALPLSSLVASMEPAAGSSNGSRHRGRRPGRQRDAARGSCQAAKEVEPDLLDLECLGCRRLAIINLRSTVCAQLMEWEEESAGILADFVRIGGRPKKAILTQQRQVATEGALRIESLDRYLEELEMVCCSCGVGRAVVP